MIKNLTFEKEGTDFAHAGSAVDMGGAIMAAQWSIVTACGFVKNNHAIGHGGGIASLGKSTLVLCHGTTMLGNRAGGSGGCVYAAGSSITIGVWGSRVAYDFTNFCMRLY